MAFKSVEQFNDDRYHNLFRITDDGGTADVVFLYQKKADMLVADVHYIGSAEYTGYVHCIGAGCPICKKKKADGTPLIRLQTKLFIPVYNIEKDAIEFWDRNMNQGFVSQLEKDVFDKFANPSEYVFRITRHGGYRDQNTRYEITAVGKNSTMPYEMILAKFNAKMPDHYEVIVKSASLSELTEMLRTTGSESPAEIQDYVPVPRAGYQSSIPNTFVNAAEAVNAASEAPVSDGSDDGDDGEVELADPIF